MRSVWASPPVRFLRDLTRLYFSARVSRSAAALAYFLILTVFPFLICVIAILGSLHLDTAQVLEVLEQVLPSGAAAVIAEYIAYITANQSLGMLLAGVSGTLLSASAAMRSMMHTMEDLYGKVRYRGLGRLIASVLFAVLFLISIYLSIVVVLTGNWFFLWLERFFRLPRLLFSWKWLRFVLLFALVFLAISLLYRFTAPGDNPRPPVLPGAALASVALAGASALFSWFISMSSRYALVYGSLASVIILMVWLYLCGTVLILGNVVNYLMHRRKQHN